LAIGAMPPIPGTKYGEINRAAAGFAYLVGHARWIEDAHLDVRMTIQLRLRWTHAHQDLLVGRERFEARVCEIVKDPRLSQRDGRLRLEPGEERIDGFDDPVVEVAIWIAPDTPVAAADRSVCTYRRGFACRSIGRASGAARAWCRCRDSTPSSRPTCVRRTRRRSV
jgi:hypothetical protein